VSGRDQTLHKRLRDSLGPVNYVEALHRLVAVKLHRALAHADNDGDLGGRLTSPHPSQNLFLTLGQVHPCMRPDAALGAAESIVDHHPKQLKIDGLGQVIIRPEPPACQLILAILESGEEDKGQPRKGWTCRAHFFEELEAAHARHADVAENEIRSLGDNPGEADFAVGGELNRIAELRQRFR